MNENEGLQAQDDQAGAKSDGMVIKRKDSVKTIVGYGGGNCFPITMWE